MNVHHLKPVEVTAKREFNPDAFVVAFCAVCLGLIIGGAGMRFILAHEPPSTCARTLEDGRRLMALNMDAEGREYRCVYTPPAHPPIETKIQHGKVIYGK